TPSGFDARPFLSDAAEAVAGFTCNPTKDLEFSHFDMTGPEPVGPLLFQAIRSAYNCLGPAAVLELGESTPPYESDPRTARYSLWVGGHRFVLEGGAGHE